jgi:hypothetical protein
VEARRRRVSNSNGQGDHEQDLAALDVQVTYQHGDEYYPSAVLLDGAWVALPDPVSLPEEDGVLLDEGGRHPTSVWRDRMADGRRITIQCHLLPHGWQDWYLVGIEPA